MRTPCAALLALLAGITPAPTPAMAQPLPTGAGAEDTTCLIKPRKLVLLGSPVAGLLSEDLVERGDTVTRGQVVARLESSVEQATLAYDRAKAQSDVAIRTEQSNMQLATRMADRKRGLVQEKIANINSLDELEAKAAEGRLRIEQAQLDQKLAMLTAERSRRLADLKDVRSSIDGVVIERKLSAGEYVYEQTPIMTIAQIDPLNVELVVPISRYGTIKLGARAEIQPNAPVGGAYTATVEVVDPVIDAASDTFGVRLLLPNPNRTIPAGIRCHVVWLPKLTAAARQ